MSFLLEGLFWFLEPAYGFQRFKLLSKYLPAHANITLKKTVIQVLVTGVLIRAEHALVLFHEDVKPFGKRSQPEPTVVFFLSS